MLRVSTVSGDGAFAEHDNAVQSMCGAQMLTRYSHDEQGRASRLRGESDAVAYFLHAGGVEVGGGSSRIMAPGCIERMPARPRRCFVRRTVRCWGGRGQVAEPYCGEGLATVPDFLCGYARLGAERYVVADGFS